MEEPQSNPDRIGPYSILDILGEGGMGTVYLAEQKTPVRRRVALKVIKLGMDSKEVLHRFDAERQALAMMEHSSIAKVFEAGTTDRGQPYFVMEYVRGIPITDHCDQHSASIEERIGLFRQVCSGVQHAHQKGVMHRDLKPSNVLVSVQEGKAVAKIIDFGLARATNHQLIQSTIFTERGLILGTPEYMSPEQAGMGGQDIDTRTDVYSLGVLLYELLVGELPFDPTELRRAGLGEMQRKIKEDDAPKPSTKLSNLGDDSEHAAKHRRTDARSLLRRMRGDLDWVVMHAIEKDRTRRYETPAALAEDLKRHLEHEPVLAGPPSAGYRLKKLARKYRGQVLAAALLVLALVGGIIGTSLGFARARENEILATERATRLDLALRDAQDQRERAEGEAERAKDAEEVAEQRAAELEQVVEFTEDQLDVIDAAAMGVALSDAMISQAVAGMERSGFDQETIAARRASMAELLEQINLTTLALDILQTNIFERSLAAIQEKFTEQPLVMARLLQAEAVILREVGLLDLASGPQAQALSIRREELGDDDRFTLESINHMGALLLAQGEYDEAEGYLAEAIEGSRRVFGDTEYVTLKSLNDMGALRHAQKRPDEAEPYWREASAGLRTTLGEENPETLTAIHNLGTLFKGQEKYEQAEDYLLEALEGYRESVGDEDRKTFFALNSMSALMEVQGYYSEAENFCVEALDGRRRLLGDTHPETLDSINRMGLLLHAQRKFAPAEPYFREGLAGRRRVLTNDHPKTLSSINNMGVLFFDQKKYAEAEPFYREALSRRRLVLKQSDPKIVASFNNLLQLLVAKGDLEAVVALYEDWDQPEEAAKWREKLENKK